MFWRAAGEDVLFECKGAGLGWSISGAGESAVETLQGDVASNVSTIGFASVPDSSALNFSAFDFGQLPELVGGQAQ